MIQALLIAGPEEEIRQIRARQPYIILAGTNGNRAFILIAAARIQQTKTITITPIILDITDTLISESYAA